MPQRPLWGMWDMQNISSIRRARPLCGRTGPGSGANRRGMLSRVARIGVHRLRAGPAAGFAPAIRAWRHSARGAHSAPSAARVPIAGFLVSRIGARGRRGVSGRLARETGPPHAGRAVWCRNLHRCGLAPLRQPRRGRRDACSRQDGAGRPRRRCAAARMPAPPVVTRAPPGRGRRPLHHEALHRQRERGARSRDRRPAWGQAGQHHCASAAASSRRSPAAPDGPPPLASRSRGSLTARST